MFRGSSMNGIVTTPEHEFARMEREVERHLSCYRPPRDGSVDERVCRIFKSSSGARMSAEAQRHLTVAIRDSINSEQPIPVSFLWAAYWMACVPYKFLDYDNIEPRLGDYWACFWLDAFNRKVQTVYPPGCEFYIIEEFEMVRLLGWSLNQRKVRQSALEPLYRRFSSIEVVDLPRLGRMPPVADPCDSEVLAILLSSPRFISRMSHRDVSTLMERYSAPGKVHVPPGKAAIPASIWREAFHIKKRMNQLGRARKTTGWLTEQVMKGRSFVDAAMIKDGRWCPKMWAMLMPQHGATVLDAHGDRYSVAIVPEYRLQDTHVPVTTRAATTGDNLVLYWQPRRSLTSPQIKCTAA